MITLLNLNPIRKARVWLDELPDLTYDPIDILEVVIDTKPSEGIRTRLAAVEIFMPIGAMVYYGLLGAAFTPNNTNQLQIQVALSNHEGRLIEWSLANKMDQVRVGIPNEFGTSIIKGVVEPKGTLSSGILRFDCAAYGAIGSAPLLFQRLAENVVKLLIKEAEQLSETELIELLQFKMSA